MNYSICLVYCQYQLSILKVLQLYHVGGSTQGFLKRTSQTAHPSAGLKAEAPRQQGSSCLPERVLTKAVSLFTSFLRVTAFPSFVDRSFNLIRLTAFIALPSPTATNTTNFDITPLQREVDWLMFARDCRLLHPHGLLV